MRIVFLTLGTRGDVQPYVAVGEALLKRGHEAIICTGESFRGLAESRGLGFHAAAADLMGILQTKEGQMLFNGGGNPFATLSYVNKVIMPLYRRSMEDFLEATIGADAIVYHPKAFGATDIAEYRGIPCISMPPVPMTVAIEEFPNLALSPKGNFGAALNRLSYKVNMWGLASFMKMVNAFRVESLGLAKRKVSDNYEDIGGKRIPVIYPVSPSLFSNVKSWKGLVDLPGFFYLSGMAETLDQKVVDFLKNGSRPFVISFSSMPLQNPKGFMDMLREALERLSQRAIVITGSSGIEAMDEQDSILTVSQLPHGLIFSEALGIVHHGGAGTVAEALKSGKPQWIMPFNVDQPFWAHRLSRLGVAVAPVKVKDLNVAVLVEGLLQLQESGIREKALEVQRQLSAEKGADNGASLIEDYVRQGRE